MFCLGSYLANIMFFPLCGSLWPSVLVFLFPFLLHRVPIAMYRDTEKTQRSTEFLYLCVLKNDSNAKGQKITGMA